MPEFINIIEAKCILYEDITKIQIHIIVIKI